MTLLASLASILSSALSIALIIFGVGFIIFVHELGHFICAKKAGVRVDAFSLGFGKAIWKRKVGDTEYRIAWIPLGGYVSMSGEALSPDRTGAPYELSSKSGFAQFCIFAAGSVMNLLISIPLFTAAYWLGLPEASPHVGVVAADSAEWDAGLEEGDILLAVGEAPIATLDQYRTTVLGLTNGERVPIKVRRAGREVTLTLVAGGSARLGVGSISNNIEGVLPGSAAEQAGLRSGDAIVAVDGVAVLTREEIVMRLQDRGGRPVPLTVLRDGQRREMTVTPQAVPDAPPARRLAVPGGNLTEYLEFTVKATRPDSPAAGAGLKPGETIRTLDGTPLRAWRDLMAAVRDRPGDTYVLEVAAVDNQVRRVEVGPRPGASGTPKLGLIAAHRAVIGVAPEGTAFEPGDRIVAIAGTAVEAEGLAEQMARACRDGGGKPVEIEVVRGTARVKVAVPVEGIPMVALGAEMPEVSVLRSYPLGAAVVEGTRETGRWIAMTWKFLEKLFTRQESPKSFSGPVGITRLAYHFAQRSSTKLIWFLGLIAVNLGVLNLLPFPVLDGGHILFLAIEKVKGSPVSLKVKEAFWIGGALVLLLMVVLVTWHDFATWIS